MDSRDNTAPPVLSIRQDLVWGFALTTAVCLAAAWFWQLTPAAPAIAVGLFAFIGWGVVTHWPVDQDFNPANRATLARSSLVVTLVASAPFIGHLTNGHLDTQLWCYAIVALTALILDGVDGALARANRCESRFGARFDMELDAALILGLCIAVLTLDKAGAWVLCLGLMRYAFVAGSAIWHWLKHPLPDSFRRKTVCVWQLVTLMVALLPPVSPAFAGITLATALALLAWSFGLDIRWLHRRRFSHD